MTTINDYYRGPRDLAVFHLERGVPPASAGQFRALLVRIKFGPASQLAPIYQDERQAIVLLMFR